MKCKLLLILLAGIHLSIYGQTNTNTNASIPDQMRWLYDSITWGSASTNGIQLGARRIAPPILNAPDKFPIIVHLCNTNESSCYGLLFSSQGHRLDLSLLDSNGKSIPRTRIGDAICKPVTVFDETRLKWERKGTVLFPKTPTQYDKFDLLDCFKIKTAGTYVLLVRGKLYKVASYPEIEPVFLPEVSLKITLTEADLDR